jgi:succinyl-diaminopimelate desuccinylase
MNAVRFEAGIANNVIPDLAEITVNHRFAPDRTAAEAVAEIEALFSGFEVEIVDIAPGARPGLNLDIAAGLLDSVDYPPRAKHGWTDVSRFSQLGIPAVNFGPGDPNLAHSDDENVPVGQLQAVHSALKNWLAAP